MSSTIHRFTPPTCTLEIQGKKSPLSRWTNQDILKKFQFQLTFDDPRLPTSKQVKIKGDRQDLEQLQIVINNYIQNFLQASFAGGIEAKINLKPSVKSLSNQPYLQPRGLVNHELFFGNLTHDTNAAQIKLSTVQLFDLVTALEAYNTQIAALPELKSSQSKKVIPLWGGLAAATVAVVGISAIALRTQSPQNVASSTKSESSVDIPELNDVIPPQIPETAKKPTPKPKLTEPLSSTKRLPPPPAVDTPKPKPDIPDPADYPLSQVARQSGLDSPTKSPTKKKNAANQQTESVITIPDETKVEQEKVAQDTAIAAAEAQRIITDSDGSDPNQQFKTEINPNADRQLAKLNNSTVKSPEELAQSNQDSSLALNNSRLKPDQLQEVKIYFEEKWQPPAELKQSLEYRLFLNSDGSIKRVVPIGKASKLYLSKTNIPVQGETFISPLTESQKSIIRLLLNPDGRVQAFTE
ncbi:MAG: DUF4335 domain-containing protein [Pleurocapsa sp. MO_192.B19]|nr:DUF4335 domain-containing protein [Pleurocapsa sp. MO_192.B19]